MGETILVIDEGTTSTRAILFDAQGRCLGSEQAELEQQYPRPGWVEHDAEEIWLKSLACARAMVAKVLPNSRQRGRLWDQAAAGGRHQ